MRAVLEVSVRMPKEDNNSPLQHLLLRLGWSGTPTSTGLGDPGAAAGHQLGETTAGCLHAMGSKNTNVPRSKDTSKACM